MINVSYVSLLCLAEGYEYFEMPVISRWPSNAPYELFLVVRRASTLESGVHLFPEYNLTYRCLLMSINSLQVAWASKQWEEGHRARPTQPRDHSLRRAVIPRRESSSTSFQVQFIEMLFQLHLKHCVGSCRCSSFEVEFPVSAARSGRGRQASDAVTFAVYDAAALKGISFSAGNERSQYVRRSGRRD